MYVIKKAILFKKFKVILPDLSDAIQGQTDKINK